MLLFLVVLYCAWKGEHYNWENTKATVCSHPLNHEPDTNKAFVSESQERVMKTHPALLKQSLTNILLYS